MKTPQRKFVVEFKSGRRRLTTQPPSIWGNTDLKALVRQAETEAPHLFEPKQELDAIGETGEIARDQGPANQLDKSDDASNQTLLVGSLIQPAPIDPFQSDHDHVGPVSRSSEQSTKWPARNRPTPIGEGRSGKPTGRTSGERRKGSFAAFVEAPADELATLDAENRRLKILLVKHLRQENLQLRKMLDRFGVV
ncbi:hypothetical protein [Rhizobium sp. CNPSo 3490]|uniref:hypothetical protein n=1 Tax=Rhizobium sp. CNPSo 3490 TaxID=3021407 RepID=UPI00254A4BBB|nr:hypothetical protein [Rhizobium sp. CNPSo 3490]MDK4731508.1 hypothetical protein [Rhizobium sp. CNPSo 3490]